MLVLPAVILAECVWVLTSFYAADRGDIASALSQLISKPGIETEDAALSVDALALYASTSADYVDCYVAARAVRDDEPVASFDQDFRKFEGVRRWKP